MRVSAGDNTNYPLKELTKERDNWSIGKATLSLFKHGPSETWIGMVRKPTQTTQFVGDDLDALVAEMEAETSPPPPVIKGFRGAIDRFLYIYPGGFSNNAFEAGERGGKLEAGRLLQPLLQADIAEADAVSLLKAARSQLNRGGQSPLHMTESSDLDRAWAGPRAGSYIAAVRAFVAQQRGEAMESMTRALEGGRCSWPMVTLYPALASPTTNAILRPDAANTFARAVGSTFTGIYESQPSVSVYEAYLKLLDNTAVRISELAPRDYLDLASFVWVSTSYSARAEPRF